MSSLQNYNFLCLYLWTLFCVSLTAVSSSAILDKQIEEATTLSNDIEETIVNNVPNVSVSLVESGEVKEIISDKRGHTVIIPVDKYNLHLGQDVPTKVIRFDCNATYPVAWNYEGNGAPFEVISKSFRHVKNFSDPSTYTFSAYLDLTKNAERNTGKYTCTRLISKNETSTHKYEKDEAFFQLYVPGEKVFLTMKKKTTTLLKNSTEFVIPCPISNSRVSSFIKLYKIGKDNTKASKVQAEYNPKLGFTLEIDPTKNRSYYKGSYFCKEPMTRKNSEKHVVLLPKEDYVRVTPNTNFVKIKRGVQQIFICAAKENVTLTFTGDRQPRIIDFEINPESEFPYLAIFEINHHLNNLTMEHTVINCVKTNDQGGPSIEPPLHVWELSSYDDVSIHKFYFDSHKRYQDARYICCSNSFYKPSLEYTFCRSETECALKKLMFDQDAETKYPLLGEYQHRISYLNDSCVMFNPYLKYTLPSGMLRCSVHGVNEKIHKDFMYYFNPYRIYQAYTDDKFDTGKVTFSESIMKLSKTPSKNTLVGQRQRFLCYFSELFLANGIVWKVQYKNGSSYLLDSSYNSLNSNTSFSQVELTFNDTNIREIHCFAPVKDSSTAWRNVTGSLFIREPPKIRASIQTLSGEILKHIYVNHSTGIILDNETLQSESFKNETFFVLDCNATFPVDFSYFGDGSPKLDYIANRTVEGSILEASSYSYSAKLRFLKADHQLVGKYSCVSATREFGHRGKEENLGSNVNVFVPDDEKINKLFVSSENQSYRAWEYRDSVLIPCPVIDPRPNITLLKYNNVTNGFEEVKGATFDPLYGFSLTKNDTPSLFGLYKCVGNRNRSSGIIQIYLPSDAIRVTPYSKEVQILKNETQLFKCESKENVTITFSDNLERKINYSFDLKSIYPYAAEYETTIGELTNLTLINCTSVQNQSEKSALWTWELYPKDGVFIDQFIFDNATNQMRCCTKPYRKATMEWINCTSVTECTIKQASCLTQNKCQMGDVIMTESEGSCLSFDVTKRPQGLLKCVVKGMHKIVAQAVVYYYNPVKNFQVFDGYFLGTKMFDKFDIQSDKIMNLEKSSGEREKIVIGEKVRFDCRGSKFFLSSTIKWGLEGMNGTTYYFEGKDLSNYNEIHSQIDLEFETSEWKSISCISPNWKEYYGWRNVSMPLLFDASESTTSSATEGVTSFVN